MPPTPRRSYQIPLRTGVLHLGERCLVMGILNLTPDSFADAQRLDAAAAIEAGLRMEAEGADLIDIGGESTRPGADPVPEREELARVVPVVRALAARLRIPISIDTTKAGVAREALACGAGLINDISGLSAEPALGEVAARHGAALILMHMRGEPKTMAARAEYRDVVGEVAAELRDTVARARAAGVDVDRTILDPGVGFAKRPEHSYGVLAGLPALAAALGRPLLVGPSRKSFLRDAVGARPAPERDWGTAAAVAAAVLAGVHIVRVHAVAEMAQVVSVAEEIRRHG
jgi:dihydropteroate synthase